MVEYENVFIVFARERIVTVAEERVAASVGACARIIFSFNIEGLNFVFELYIHLAHHIYIPITGFDALYNMRFGDRHFYIEYRYQGIRNGGRRVSAFHTEVFYHAPAREVGGAVGRAGLEEGLEFVYLFAKGGIGKYDQREL